MAIFDDFRRSSTISWFRASGQQQQQQPYIFSMKLLTVSFSQLVVRAIDEIWLIFARLIEKGWCSRDWSRKVDYDKPFDGEILAVFKNSYHFPAYFLCPCVFWTVWTATSTPSSQVNNWSIQWHRHLWTSHLFSALMCVCVANQWTKRPTTGHAFLWRCKNILLSMNTPMNRNYSKWKPD